MQNMVSVDKTNCHFIYYIIIDNFARKCVFNRDAISAAKGNPN